MVLERRHPVLEIWPPNRYLRKMAGDVCVIGVAGPLSETRLDWIQWGVLSGSRVGRSEL